MTLKEKMYSTLEKWGLRTPEIEQDYEVLIGKIRQIGKEGVVKGCIEAPINAYLLGEIFMIKHKHNPVFGQYGERLKKDLNELEAAVV